MKKILISGAGIAGLTLAYWLKKRGFSPTIVEKHPTLRTGGYKIDIRGAALDVVKEMGLYETIFASRTEIRGATFIDQDGKQITEMSGDLYGLRAEGELEIIRGDLCQILYQHVTGVEYLFDDSIRQIQQEETQVQVSFERASPRFFDFVIGADGLHSTVRRLVFGEEPRFLHPLGIYISVFTIPNFLHLDRWEMEYQESRKFINVFSARGDLDAKAALCFSANPLPPYSRDILTQKHYLKTAFATAKWETPRILEALDTTSDFYFDAVAQVHMPQWYSHRVALIGDAGYCPSPLSGQGTSLAIVGAYILAGELANGQETPAVALSRYDKCLRRFVKKNQKLANFSVQIMTGTDDSLLARFSHFLRNKMPEKCLLWIQKWLLRRITKAANSICLKNRYL